MTMYRVVDADDSDADEHGVEHDRTLVPMNIPPIPVRGSHVLGFKGLPGITWELIKCRTRIGHPQGSAIHKAIEAGHFHIGWATAGIINYPKYILSITDIAGQEI